MPNKSSKYGTRGYMFTSVSNQRNGIEIIVSNQEKETPRVKRLLKEGRLAYISKATLPSEFTASAQGDQSAIPSEVLSSNNKDTTSSPNIQEKGAKFSLADAADKADIVAERKAIEETAKANGTWLKAPNGQPTNRSSKQWVDVRTKRFKAWLGDWELAANIRSGINALLQISQGADSVPNAMQRSELSKLGGTAEITFDWGKYGKRDKSGTLRGGFGFAKIIQKHGYNEAVRIIETIARGKLGTPYGVEGGTRIDIVNGEYHTTISLYRDGQRESWVLTGYKIDPNTDAKGRGNDLSDATQTYPTPTREDLGAALKSTANIQYFNEISNISSKIVDANGEPKVVYHQTNATEYVNVETGELGL